MKRHRAIIIKDPRLQKIRDNLRALIIHESVSRRKNLYEEGRFKEEILLDRSVNKSICRCSSCRKINRDRVYNPSLNMWFCVECYRLSQDTYKEILEKKSRGEPLGDLCENYYKTFI